MEAFEMSSVISAAIIMMMILVSSVEGQNQINTACTSSMISSFTPCANLITGSSNNGTTPTSTCCESLRSLMSTSTECACMVISANVPLQLPITSALALSLTQACNMNGLSAQCKASGSPLPAPGPASLGGNDPPTTAASPLSPGGSKGMGVAKVDKMKSRRLAEAEAPASAAVEVEAPTITTPGIRPILTPPSSFSYPSYVSFSPFVLLFIATIIVSTTIY